MSRLTKNISKILACALLLALIFPLVNLGGDSLATNSGQVKVQDHQFIVVEQDPSGKPDLVRVVDWLALKGDGTVDVKRTTGLKKPPLIQNLKGFSAPEVKDDTITWKGLKANGTVNVSNVISQNVLEKEDLTESAMTEKVPLKVRYSYYLDGKKVKDLKDIAGKSGKFRLECYMKNLSKKKEMVTYTDSTTGERKTEVAETHLPLVITPMDWYFDNEVFSNVKTDPTVIISYIPTDYQLSFVAPLFPPATEVDYTIWLEADVKNFSMKPLSLTCAFVFPKTNQVDPIPQFQAGLAQLYGGVAQLGAGLGQMITGLGSPGMSQTLIWGISQLTGGLEQLADPGAGLPFAESMIRTQFIPGAETLLAGLGSSENATSLLGGMNQIFNGLSQMQTGIGTAETPDTLLYGANAITGGLNQTAAGIGSTSTPGTLLYGSNAIAGGLTQMTAGIGSATTPNTLLYAMTVINAGIGDPTTPGTLLNGLAQVRTGLTNPSATDTADYGLKEGLDAIALSLSEPGGLIDKTAPVDLVISGQPGNIYTALNSTTVGLKAFTNFVYGYFIYAYASVPTATYYRDKYLALIQGLSDGITGSDPTENIYGGAQYLLATLEDAMLPGVAKLVGGVDQITAGFGSATTPDTILYGVNAVIGGLTGIQAGIGSPTTENTLLYAANAITGGLMQVQGGIGSAETPNTLLFGTNAITGGLTQMQGGLGSATTPDTLLYGANAIYGGLSQIKGSVSTGSQANPGLLEGLEQLGSGLSQAVTGLGSASNPNSLIGGSTQINSGLEQLKAGIVQATTQGTDVMKAGLADSLKELDLTVGELEAIAQRGDKFDTFLGRVKNKGSTSDIRFLLQTKPVQNPNQNNGWLIALVIALIGAAALVVLGLFAFKKYA